MLQNVRQSLLCFPPCGLRQKSGHVCNYFTEAAALICSLIVFMRRIILRAKICSSLSSDEPGDAGCAVSLHCLCIPLATYVSACHLSSSILLQ